MVTSSVDISVVPRYPECLNLYCKVVNFVALVIYAVGQLTTEHLTLIA